MAVFMKCLLSAVANVVAVSIVCRQPNSETITASTTFFTFSSEHTTQGKLKK